MVVVAAGADKLEAAHVWNWAALGGKGHGTHTWHLFAVGAGARACKHVVVYSTWRVWFWGMYVVWGNTYMLLGEGPVSAINPSLAHAV